MYLRKTLGHLLTIIICSICLFLSTPLSANDTLVGESGHTVFPINTDKVRMISEHVKVKMNTYDLKGITSKARRAFVSCDFVFENTSSEEIKAQLGFPGSIYRWTDAVTAPTLNHFISYIDGSKKKVQTKKEILNQRKNRYSIDGKEWKEEVVEDYRYWYTWDVTFPPLKRISVKNTYWVTLSSDQKDWWFEYILTTGSNWKGNIEKALIEVIYPNEKDLRNRVAEIAPKGYKIDKNKIIWEFTNFKPTDNIKVTEKWLEKQQWLKK